jgi:uncharacterized membrane protein YfcA
LESSFLVTLIVALMALALVAGFVGSLSGLGGGMFIVPALVIFAHVPMQVAVGASLMAVVATSAGASVAFVRDGWTNLKVAIVMECATVNGAIAGAFLAGLASTTLLELLFALVMLQSAYFSLRKRDSEPLATSDRLCHRLGLNGSFPEYDGSTVSYGVANLPGGAALMTLAGWMSGLLGIGSGALKVIAMDQIMHLPLKVSSATSNFMIGVTAGAGALVFLARGYMSPMVAAPVALGVTAGAIAGSKLLPYANVRWLRAAFVGILVLVAAEMGWRAITGV